MVQEVFMEKLIWMLHDIRHWYRKITHTLRPSDMTHWSIKDSRKYCKELKDVGKDK